jgi:hypothetical protein
MNASLLPLAALFLAGCAGAGEPVTPAAQLCFEADMEAVEARNDWSHYYVVLLPGRPFLGALGRPYRSVTGYGYNRAPNTEGEGDLVPLSGAAVLNNRNQWIVSLTGTLHQVSTVTETDPGPRYWLITQSWQFDPGTVDSGRIHVGNLNTPFALDFPESADDSADKVFWRIDCSTLPQ